MMRRFVTYRATPPENYVREGFANPPEQVQVMGAVFPDGTVACQWQTEHRSHVIWPSFDDFMAVHGHPEYGSRIEWLDEAQENRNHPVTKSEDVPKTAPRIPGSAP